MEQRLLLLLEREPGDQLKELRANWLGRKTLQKYLDAIPANAQKARNYLTEYEQTLADQGEQEDEWD